MLKQDEPVNVKSNRLNYDGANSLATYEGNATLWQDDTTIKADKIVVEDKTGNLRATTNVMTIDDAHRAGRQGRGQPAPKPAPEAGSRPSRRPTSCSTRTRSTAPPTPATRT